RSKSLYYMLGLVVLRPEQSEQFRLLEVVLSSELPYGDCSFVRLLSRDMRQALEGHPCRKTLWHVVPFFQIVQRTILRFCWAITMRHTQQVTLPAAITVKIFNPHHSILEIRSMFQL